MKNKSLLILLRRRWVKAACRTVPWSGPLITSIQGKRKCLHFYFREYALMPDCKELKKYIYRMTQKEEHDFRYIKG